MKNHKKLVVSDYDGTFFLDEDGIKKNIEKVNEFREKDNLFAIATGNNLRRFKEVIQQYGITYDYLILDQGACIFDNQGNMLKACFLDYDSTKKIMHEIEQVHKQYKLCNPYTEAESLEGKDITKIGINFTDLQEAIDFTNRINQKFGKYVNAYTMIFSDINIVEIISSETDKNEAIKYVIEKEGISKNNVYTIGDGYNDISMIQNFNGYCMENSVDELLKRCPERVGSVSELLEKVSDLNKENDLTER